jgi:formiminoglutamase
MDHFMQVVEFYHADSLRQLTSIRDGETKLGERLVALSSFDTLKQYAQPFVLLGVSEDIGVRANLGRAGAASCWPEVLKALCNVQCNSFFDGSALLIGGCLKPEALMEEAQKLNQDDPKDLKQLRALTEKVDALLYPLVKKIVEAGKIPIIIGGGHNNAYGNIKGCFKALNHSIGCLNIDPHADFRSLEGRHSGNGFSYAHREGALGKYFVWGLHEGYNNQSILNTFEEHPELSYCSFEQLLLKDFAERDTMLKHALHWLGEHIGLELDLDSIENFPASALNASGFGINEIRHCVRTSAALAQPLYFHICEGAPYLALSDAEKALTGKRISYLIVDFIKAHPIWNS